MNTNRYIAKDAQSALDDVQRFHEELKQFEDLDRVQAGAIKLNLDVANDLQEFNERASDLLSRLIDILGDITDIHTENPQQGASFSLSTLAGEVRAQIEWLTAILERLEELGASDGQDVHDWFSQNILPCVGRAITKIRQYLMPMLKKILSKIWQIISHLMTPTQWKLQGKVGTSILGLADVGVEITFGP